MIGQSLQQGIQQTRILACNLINVQKSKGAAELMVRTRGRVRHRRWMKSQQAACRSWRLVWPWEAWLPKGWGSKRRPSRGSCQEQTLWGCSMRTRKMPRKEGQMHRAKVWECSRPVVLFSSTKETWFRYNMIWVSSKKTAARGRGYYYRGWGTGGGSLQ